MSNLNKKLVKLILVIIIGALLVVGICTAIGLTIGGAPSLGKQAIFAAAGFLLGYCSVWVLFPEKRKAARLPVESVLAATVIFLILFRFGYDGLNRMTAETKYAEYQTVITGVDYRHRSWTEEIFFTDRNGNEVSLTRMSPILYTEDEPEEGKTATVRERQGGFGYPVYEITEINE